VRGFSVQLAVVHSGLPWSKISDHAALSAHLEWAGEALPAAPESAIHGLPRAASIASRPPNPKAQSV
jgi:hypothetical protein